MHTTIGDLVDGQIFSFTNENNGTGEYTEVGDSHYRRVGNVNNVCLPINALPAKGGCRVFLEIGP